MTKVKKTPNPVSKEIELTYETAGLTAKPIQIEPEIVEPVIVSETDKLLDEILKFVFEFKGKSKMNYTNQMKMFNLYNRYFKTNKKPEPSCSTCNAKTFKALEDLICEQ